MVGQRIVSRFAVAAAMAAMMVTVACEQGGTPEDDLLALLRDEELDPAIAAAAASATGEVVSRSLVAPFHQDTRFGSWTFNDCSSQRTELRDAMPGNHTAYRSVGVECVPGVAGQAVSIEDLDDIVYVPDQPDFTFEHGVTVAGWVMATELGRTRTVFRKRDKGTSSFALVVNARNRFQFVVNLGDGQAASVTSRAVVEVGRFYHVAATYDGRTLRLYVDGVEVAGAGAAGAIPPGPGPFLMGNDGSERRFDGILENVYFEGRGLSPEEVLALTCVRPQPTVVMTPTSATVAPGEAAGFDIAVTNNNPAVCAPITINFATLMSYPGILDTLPQPGVLVSMVVASGETAHFSATAFTHPSAPAGSFPLFHLLFASEGEQTFELTGVTVVVIERPPIEFAFAAPVAYPAPFNAVGIELADVNRDGALDVVVSVSSGFAVLLGNGDGTLAPAAAYRVASMSAEDVAVADLNGDTWPDVVLTGQGSTTLAIALGNGDGTFGSPSEYAIDRYLSSAAVGDLDRDGAVDLVVSSFLDGVVRVLPGNGDGTFGGGAAYATNASPSSVVLVDLFNRGVLDVLVNTYAGSVTVFIANGDGTLQNGADYFGNGPGEGLAFGDLDGDGTVDLVRAECCGANSATIMRGAGGGFNAIRTVPALMSPFGAAIADFNADGRPDVVLAGEDDVVFGSGPNVSILGGAGGGFFDLSAQYTSGFLSRDVAAGDLDADGGPDFVVAANQSESQTVWVFLNAQ